MLILDNRIEITQDKMRNGKKLWGEGRSACTTFKEIFIKVSQSIDSLIPQGENVTTSIILHTHNLYHVSRP